MAQLPRAVRPHLAVTGNADQTCTVDFRPRAKPPRRAAGMTMLLPIPSVVAGECGSGRHRGRRALWKLRKPAAAECPVSHCGVALADRGELVERIGEAMGIHTGISIERQLLRDFERSSRLEWLETNGLGGWAMSTVAGAHSRRYHGLLVAATRPPIERMVLLSRLDETVRRADRAIELGASRFPGAVHPRGFERLTRFERDLFPIFEYDLEGVVEGAVLRKTVAAIAGENTVVVLYELVAGDGAPARPGRGAAAG